MTDKDRAIQRMIAILKVLKDGDEHRPDIIRQVIEIGEHALRDDNGE
jgi:hypothetical protein